MPVVIILLRFSYANIEVQLYVTLCLMPFNVNYDIILLLTFYKQISAVILKPNSDVTSPTLSIFTNIFCGMTAYKFTIFVRKKVL